MTVFLSISRSEKVAELSYVATLEDLGLVKATEVIVSDSSQVRQLCVCVCLCVFISMCACAYINEVG